MALTAFSVLYTGACSCQLLLCGCVDVEDESPYGA